MKKPVLEPHVQGLIDAAEVILDAGLGKATGEDCYQLRKAVVIARATPEWRRNHEYTISKSGTYVVDVPEGGVRITPLKPKGSDP